MRIGDARVYGRVHDVSIADIDAVIAAMQAELPEVCAEQLREIDVRDGDTIFSAVCAESA